MFLYYYTKVICCILMKLTHYSNRQKINIFILIYLQMVPILNDCFTKFIQTVKSTSEATFDVDIRE